jgi:threonyl-tRNA synthetase
MSLEFVIIPASKDLEQVAFDIKSKLTSCSKLPVTVDFDFDYSVSSVNKILKWKKKEYDIIVINEDFLETNRVVVRFSDKGSKQKTMELDEFIDLVASFDDDNDDTEKSNDVVTIEDNSEGGCSIM